VEDLVVGNETKILECRTSIPGCESQLVVRVSGFHEDGLNYYMIDHWKREDVEKIHDWLSQWLEENKSES
jgi:hypothetical protein